MRELTHEQPGRQVPGRVEGVAAVEAQADPQAEDGESLHPRETGGAVSDRADCQGQQGGGQQLVTSPAQPAEVRPGETGEDRGRVGERPGQRIEDTNYDIMERPNAIKTQQEARYASGWGNFVQKLALGGYRCLKLCLHGIREDHHDPNH